MISNYNKGKLFEFFACILLSLKGYSIIEKRYKNKFGEIDIICVDNNDLVFVEVKYRKNKDNALEAVREKQIKRIVNCASIYSSSHKYMKFNIRFDVVLFYNVGIKHIKKIVGL